MALVEELEEDLPEVLHHRQLERSTLMQNAVALYFSDQVLRKELKSYSNVKSYSYRRLGDQQQKKGGDCKQWSSHGSCSRFAKGASKHDEQSRGYGKGDKRQLTPGPTTRQPAPKSDVSDPTGTRPSGKEGRRSCYSYEKGSCQTQHKRHPPFCIFHKKRRVPIRYELSLRPYLQR